MAGEVQAALQATVDRMNARLDSLDETTVDVADAELIHPFLLSCW